jgi:hypothetical protein
MVSVSSGDSLRSERVLTMLALWRQVLKSVLFREVHLTFWR